MTTCHISLLSDRGAVTVIGVDARKLLQGLITNDMDKLQAPGDALHAGLLTPQGKILFAFFVVQTTDGFILETERDEASALAQRLTFYKLRAAVKIEDVSEQLGGVALAWSKLPSRLRGGGNHEGQHSAIPSSPSLPREGGGKYDFRDPRHPDLGWRMIGPLVSLPAATSTAADYHAHRIGLAVPDAQYDYPLGDTYPHEAGFDMFHGADFDKGCFVGQEVVARMQHKTIVRKRIAAVEATEDLPADHPDVTMGSVIIGRLGSVAGRRGLALIRLDRAIEALDKGEPITTAGIALALDAEAIAAFRAAAAARSNAS